MKTHKTNGRYTFRDTECGLKLQEYDTVHWDKVTCRNCLNKKMVINNEKSV